MADEIDPKDGIPQSIQNLPLKLYLTQRLASMKLLIYPYRNSDVWSIEAFSGNGVRFNTFRRTLRWIDRFCIHRFAVFWSCTGASGISALIGAIVGAGGVGVVSILAFAHE